MNWALFLGSHGWDLLAMGLLLVLSGLISGTETALFNLSRGQLYRMRQSSGNSARRVAALMHRPQSILNTLLLANLLVNIPFASLGSVLALDAERQNSHVSHWSLAAITLVPLIALILLGEVMPKLLAFVSAQHWATAAARPLAMLEQILRPVLWVLDSFVIGPITRIVAPRRVHADITADDLNDLLGLSARRGLIGHDASALLQEIVELTELRVGDIMVPRVEMIAWDINDPPQGLVELFRTSHLRKIPVYDGQPDKILGVIYGKELLLNPGKGLGEMIAHVPFVPEAAKIERVLIQFRVTRRQMAFVVDEFGGVAGLVTLQDIVEEIVGDIPDVRDDAEGAVQRQGDRKFLIDGLLHIHEWADAFHIDLSAGRISTIGGFVTSLMGRMPHEGDQVRYRNLLFTVQSMRGRRIGKLLVELTEGKP